MCRNKEETSQLTFKKPWPDHLTMAGPLFRQFNEIHYIYIRGTKYFLWFSRLCSVASPVIMCHLLVDIQLL